MPNFESVGGRKIETEPRNYAEMVKKIQDRYEEGEKKAFDRLGVQNLKEALEASEQQIEARKARVSSESLPFDHTIQTDPSPAVAKVLDQIRKLEETAFPKSPVAEPTTSLTGRVKKGTP